MYIKLREVAIVQTLRHVQNVQQGWSLTEGACSQRDYPIRSYRLYARDLDLQASSNDRCDIDSRTIFSSSVAESQRAAIRPGRGAAGLQRRQKRKTVSMTQTSRM